MSKARGKEKFWRDFERELAEAIEQDKAKTKQERRAWLDTLPEFVAPEGNMVRVIFLGAGKSSGVRPKKGEE